MAKKEVKELGKSEGGQNLPVFWDMDRMMNEFFGRPMSPFGAPVWRFPETREIVPSVDVFEDGGEIVVKAELPGIKKEDVDVTVTDDTITISGEKNKETEVKKKDYYRWECSYGSFNRTFTLPAEVQPDKAKTKFSNGVLEIRLPRTEEAKKKERKIKID